MITLSKVTLKNFKVYGGAPYTIDFEDNRLILLDGPNGYGKTSVFDAIELALTGNIRRLIVLESRQNPSDIVVAHNGEKDVEIIIELVDKLSNNRIFQRKLKSTITNAARRIGNFSELWDFYEIIDGQSVTASKNTLDLLFNSKDFSRDFLLFHYIEQEDTSRFLKSNNEQIRAQELSKLFGDTTEADQNLLKLNETKRKIAASKRAVNLKISSIKSLHKLNDIDKASNGEIVQHVYALPWFSQAEKPFWDRPTIAQLNEERLNKALAELAKIRDLTVHQNFFLRSRHYHRAIGQRAIIELYVGYANAINQYERLEENHKKYQLVARSKDLLTKNEIKAIDRNLETSELFSVLGLENPTYFSEALTSLLELTEKSQGLSSIYSELLKHHSAIHQQIDMMPTETECALCGHDYGTHESLSTAIADHGHLLRSELGDQDRRLVADREAFEKNHLNPLLKACNTYLEAQQPATQSDLTMLAKAVSAKLRLERLRTWLESEGIVNNDLVADSFPVKGGDTFILESAEILCDRIRFRIGTPTESYDASYGEDVFERLYSDYFKSEPDNLRNFDPSILDNKERFIRTQYFSSLIEVTAELNKLQQQDTILDKALNDMEKLINIIKVEIGKYRKKLITDIEIPFYIYSGKILQSHQAGLGQGVFIKDPLGEDVLKNVRLVSDWKSDHDIMNTMSSGQISAVVIALTLALNKVYSKKFSTILIDDPVQTMDDINMSSLVELLRNNFSDRQIILSTHEEKVARYFTYKYIKHSGKVKIINLMQRKEYVPANTYIYRDAVISPKPTSE
ncbi:AAA family ATPase [Pseudomonas syringae]|uniref:AAA family ATPase n=1 Tax=Pseudomonas syringae TaxID=317 RepID=UPI00073F064D|nr:AAA family ATPase [Pseudomonas syringae]